MSIGKKRGTFITIDGVEGAGKTTQIEFIKQYLDTKLPARQLILKTTREPGGTILGNQLREIMLDTSQSTIMDDAELLMMFAARAQHIQQVIEPTLVAGDWVLCDRFTDSTYAYQGGGRGIALNRISVLEDWVQCKLRPDITVILDLPVDVGMLRVRNRGEFDRFESEQLSFFERVRQVYLDRAHANPQRYCIIDATQSVEQIMLDISSVLDKLLKK